MSNKFRPEFALSVFLNEQFLGVLPITLPNDLHGSVEINSHESDPIPLAVHLVGDRAACEAIRFIAMEKLEAIINVLGGSDFDDVHAFAFDVQEMNRIPTCITDLEGTIETITYDANSTLMDHLGTTTRIQYTQPPEPPVDPTTIVE